MSDDSQSAHPTGDWPIPSLGAWSREPDQHQVAVIGAGIGGLAAGALLARRGVKVLVVEAHDRPGGCCTSWTRKARLRDGSVGQFTFDAGVQDMSGLGSRGPLRHLLTELDVAGAIEWQRVRHRYIQDDLCLDIPDDPSQLPVRLGQLFPADAEGIDRFLVAITGVYRDLYADVEQTGGIPQPPTTPAAIAAWPTLRPDANRWMQRGYVEMLDAFIVDPRPKRMLTTIAEYVTDQPDRLTVGEMAPLFGYYLEGGSYPVGGSQKLADLLSSVIEGHGGRVQLATTVDRILIDDGVVKGIGTADGGVHWAPVVVGNGDVRAMLTELIPPATLPRRYQQRIASRRPGPSAILVSLGLDIVPDLPTRVFLATGDLQFGIGNPSLIDPSLAPPGCAALTLMSLVSEEQAADWFHLDRRAYHVAKTEYVKRLLAAVDLIVPGIERHSRYRQIGSSRTFARYLRTSAGGIYGGPRRQWKPAMKSPIPGLLLVGGGTRTGPGIEAVVISGIAAANAIAAGQPASMI